MMRRLIITDRTEAELQEAAEWYERESEGLGQRFTTTAEHFVAELNAEPQRFPRRYRHARRALVTPFSYALYFVYDATSVTVVAALHTSRDSVRLLRGRLP